MHLHEVIDRIVITRKNIDEALQTKAVIGEYKEREENALQEVNETMKE